MAAHVSNIPADVLAEVDRIVRIQDPAASTLMTGSWIEGFGNENSDIDLYVVRDDQPGQGTAIGLRRSRYIDCEYFDTRGMCRLADRLEDVRWADIGSLALRDVNRYYRLSIAVPVRVSERVEQLLTAFDRGRACRAYARLALAIGHERLGLGAYLLNAGQVVAARAVLRESALWMCNSILADDGEGYPSVKWLGEKAARRFGRGSEEFRAVVDPYLRPGRDARSHLQRLRDIVPIPDELRAAVGARQAALVAGVRRVADGNTTLLVHESKSIVRIGGLAQVLVGLLDNGANWREAVQQVTVEIDGDEAEIQAAAWHVTGPLRAAGFLTEKTSDRG